MTAEGQGNARPIMEQRWRDLLFLHWAVAASDVAPLVPDGLTVDTFDGDAYLGLVFFSIPFVRHRSLPLTWGFHETNARTYVRRGDRRGVWFFSLDAASTPAVLGARLTYGLPYFRSTLRIRKEGDRIRYSGERRWPSPKPADYDVEAVVGADRGVAPPGSLNHFLVERYSLFALRRGRLVSATVVHEPYRLCDASVLRCEESLSRAAGMPAPPTPPLTTFSAGVDVRVCPATPFR